MTIIHFGSQFIQPLLIYSHFLNYMSNAVHALHELAIVSIDFSCLYILLVMW